MIHLISLSLMVTALLAQRSYNTLPGYGSPSAPGSLPGYGSPSAPVITTANQPQSVPPLPVNTAFPSPNEPRPVNRALPSLSEETSSSPDIVPHVDGGIDFSQ